MVRTRPAALRHAAETVSGEASLGAPPPAAWRSSAGHEWSSYAQAFAANIARLGVDVDAMRDLAGIPSMKTAVSTWFRANFGRQFGAPRLLSSFIACA